MKFELTNITLPLLLKFLKRRSHNDTDVAYVIIPDKEFNYLDDEEIRTLLSARYNDPLKPVAFAYRPGEILLIILFLLGWLLSIVYFVFRCRKLSFSTKFAYASGPLARSKTNELNNIAVAPSVDAAVIYRSYNPKVRSLMLQREKRNAIAKDLSSRSHSSLSKTSEPKSFRQRKSKNRGIADNVTCHGTLPGLHYVPKISPVVKVENSPKYNAHLTLPAHLRGSSSLENMSGLESDKELLLSPGDHSTNTPKSVDQKRRRTNSIFDISMYLVKQQRLTENANYPGSVMHLPEVNNDNNFLKPPGMRERSVSCHDVSHVHHHRY